METNSGKIKEELPIMPINYRNRNIRSLGITGFILGGYSMYLAMLLNLLLPLYLTNTPISFLAYISVFFVPIVIAAVYMLLVVEKVNKGTLPKFEKIIIVYAILAVVLATIDRFVPLGNLLSELTPSMLLFTILIVNVDYNLKYLVKSEKNT